MNERTRDLLRQIESLRADVRALEAKLSALARSIADENELAVAPERRLMYVVEYAQHARVSASTVRRWLAAGLPCVRRGRSVRIKVAEADAWAPADEIAVSAKRSAHDRR